MPKLTRAAVDDRLAKINPSLFLTEVASRLEVDGPGVLDRLFSIAKDPNVSPMIGLTAIRMIVEMSGTLQVMSAIAARAATQIVPPPPPEVGQGAVLNDADRQRYERLAPVARPVAS